MPVVSRHPDEFTLLRFVAGDVDQMERARVRRHVRTCAECGTNLEATRHLDETFREHARDIVDEGDLPETDVFRSRPAGVARPFRDVREPAAFAARCAEARREAEPLKSELLAPLAAGEADPGAAVRALSLERLAARLALGWALDESPRLFGEAPRRWDAFARASIAAAGAAREEPGSAAAYAYPLGDLLGRAHTLAGWARNWGGELEAAGVHLASAWSAFASGSASAGDFASVELHESQRRTFLERPAEGLVLAARAEATFRVLALDVFAAKARFAEGLALTYLHREEEAIPRFESALEPLAAAGLWNAYASVLNNLASTYVDLERYDRARRTYAQALRRVTRERNPGVHAFIRLNLGIVQLRSSRPAEAARAFADAASAFDAQGSAADALVATIYEVEALARFDLPASRRLLASFEERVARRDALEPSALAAIRTLLEGEDPDLGRLSELRAEAEGTIRARLRA